jgi:hypothetical protein
MTESGQGQESLESLRAEAAGLQERMEEIRAETETEVLKKWSSPWKSPDTVKVKVDARLASHDEFRSIVTKVRNVQARERELYPGDADPTANPTKGHPAVR